MPPLPDPLNRLLSFCAALDEAHISYRLNTIRPAALMVELAIPGERWEIEFLIDGTVEIEKFRSDGEVYDAAELASLFASGGG
jgi:hypothetical protein